MRDERPSGRTSCAPTIETIVFARDLGIIRGKLSPQLSHLFAIACFILQVRNVECVIDTRCQSVRLVVLGFSVDIHGDLRVFVPR